MWNGLQEARDFAWIFVDGRQVGILDRRYPSRRVQLPERAAPAQLDLLVEAMGHVNIGQEVHDRKGLRGPVRVLVGDTEALTLSKWQVFQLNLDSAMLGELRWQSGKASGPAFWRGQFSVQKAADTFLDVSAWGKGVVWINGRCLGRFWNIGPTQAMYVPGPWLNAGRNEVIVLDLLGPQEPALAGLDQPVLDRLRPELDFSAPPSRP